MSNPKVYIIYDGRALHDTDEAAVLEACGNGRRDLREALYNWRGHDAVLVEYDSVGEGKPLENERVVGHLSVGRRELLARLSATKVTS